MENGAFKSVWQGLSFYTEEDRTLFYGRDRETEQLCDEIGRSPLCIVYGPSGAGKTSLLRAGVFPRLRAGGWLPVYVRLDHSGNARPYALQVEEAVLAAAGAARLVVEERCPPLSSSRGETLWEWFHRHVFRNAFKKEIRPVVVIDQFEEIFTLARAGETADAWFAELSDLAENSVPAVVVRDMENADESLAFSTEDQSWRVVASLREDFLPRLEDRAAAHPVFSRSRFAVGAFTRQQALEVVTGPGKDICPPAVAQAIVDAVGKTEGGGGDRVEPALLSLFCMRLDGERQRAGLAEITPELVETRGRDILNRFYEETMGGVSERTRDILEDWLLTASGYRDSMAVEDVEAEGVPRSEWERLENARLLHVEHRGGIRWLEFSHDILAPVAREARARRSREREMAVSRGKVRFYRKLSVALGGLVALFLVSAQVWWFVFQKEYTTVYRDWVKKFGNPVGIGDPLKEEEWRHRQCSFRLHRKGAMWWRKLRGLPVEVFLVEAINGRGEPTTTHTFGTYLWRGDSESSEGGEIDKRTQEAMKSVCAWKFERSEKGREHDGLSRPSTETALDRNGNKVWVCRYEFDSDDANWWENPVLVSFTRPSGVSMRQRNDKAEYVQITYDEDTGHETLIEFLDGEKRHTPGPDGSFAQAYRFDTSGRVAELRSRGWDKTREKYTNIIDRAGNCGLVFKYDGNESKESRSIGIDNETCPVNTGYDHVVASFDEWGNLTRQVFYLGGHPVALTNGLAEQRLSYSDYGFLEELEDLAFPCEGGLYGMENVHRLVGRYDENGDQVEVHFYDASGNPTPGWSGTPVIRRQFAAPGQCSLEWYEDGNGTAITNCNGIARDCYEFRKGRLVSGDVYALPGQGGAFGFTNVHHVAFHYDGYGNCTNKRYFTADDFPARGGNNIHSLHFRYATFGEKTLCVEEWYLDEREEPSAGDDGVTRVRYAYDDDGKIMLRRELLAAEGEGGLLGQSNLQRQVCIYDKSGNLKEELYYDVWRKPAKRSSAAFGYSHGRNSYYDNHGVQSVTEAWAPSGEGGVSGLESVHHLVRVQNENGTELVRFGFQADGRPADIGGGTFGYAANFDSQGQEQGTIYQGTIYFGPRNNGLGYAEERLENGKKVFYDEDGKLVHVESIVVIHADSDAERMMGFHPLDVVLGDGDYSFLHRSQDDILSHFSTMGEWPKGEQTVPIARNENGKWKILQIHLSGNLPRMFFNSAAVSEIKRIEEAVESSIAPES